MIGVNQSWREVPGADAHFANDGDQFDFDNPIAAGFGGRDYYERLGVNAYHSRAGGNIGTMLDRHDALIFSRRPFQKRHRGAHHPNPGLTNDGGFALKIGPNTSGSSGYVALQMAAASGFLVIWLAGFDMDDKKFDGAQGYTQVGKKVPTSIGAWSNSDKQDRLWACVPADVKAVVRVIEPSRTKQLEVVPWPW